MTEIDRPGSLDRMLLVRLGMGDERAALQLAQLRGRVPARSWWFRLIAAMFALGARYPVRTAGVFGVGVLLLIVLGYPAADLTNRLNLWLTPLVPLVWLDYHVHWLWGFAVRFTMAWLIGLVMSLLDPHIAVASIAGLATFLLVRCVLQTTIDLMGGQVLASALVWRWLDLPVEVFALLTALQAAPQIAMRAATIGRRRTPGRR